VGLITTFFSSHSRLFPTVYFMNKLEYSASKGYTGGILCDSLQYVSLVYELGPLMDSCLSVEIKLAPNHNKCDI